MLDTVLKKTGEGVGGAVGAGGEAVAGGYIDFMLSPYGLAVVVAIFLLIRWVR
jgi:hypothetical protein